MGIYSIRACVYKTVHLMCVCLKVEMNVSVHFNTKNFCLSSDDNQ